MLKTTIALIVVIVLAGGAFLYATRPAAAPSQDINSATNSDTAVTATASSTTYRISQASSTIEFTIGEILNDKPKTVVGITDQVAGDIMISGNTVSFGTLAVNARTFKTDSEKRDGAIARFILKSEDAGNEFMTLKPDHDVHIEFSLPSDLPLVSSITGNLTIGGVTKSVMFETRMKIGKDIITGTATTKLKRADFNLKIPEVKSVASVDEEFTVTATITANKITN
ncbi:MAG: YceI family protein [Candidatus Pacebacteria bacterium]|nr:YceI family protein [Candidatus Paceibacterota bacterium]